MLQRPRTVLLLILLATAPSWVVAQGSASPPDSAAWIQSDSAARSVRLTLQTSHLAGSPSATINGAREGEVQIVVPLGWTVAWDWRSTDSTARHSLVVMAEREKLPTEGGRPAFINAMTRMVIGGLDPAQPDRTTFEADQPGWYWLLCGVPSHALLGEWIGLRVDPEARSPTLKRRER